MLRALDAVIDRALVQVFGRFGQSSGLLPALASTATVPNASPNPGDGYDLRRLVDDMRTLWGVPKSKTPKEVKQTRKFDYTRQLSRVDGIVSCPACGTRHLAHCLCHECYEKVREETQAIKRRIMAYNPYVGERQDKPIDVHYESDESRQPKESHMLVEMPKPRPSWFLDKFGIKPG